MTEDEIKVLVGKLLAIRRMVNSLIFQLEDQLELPPIMEKSELPDKPNHPQES